MFQNLADDSDVNEQKNPDGKTALIFAAHHGNYEHIDILLQAGADVNQQDKYGDTALTWAA